MSVLDKFLKYVKIDTKAGEERENQCSDDRILNLSRVMLDELRKLNPDELEMNKFGTVYAYFKGDENKKSVAFLAHMDTAPVESDTDVKPQIVRYIGQDVKLNEDMYLKEKDFPTLKNALNHDIVTTDGTTLLGGDDKAGIAIIMQSLEDTLLNNSAHRPIEVIFTTDEEIGADAKHVSMDKVKSKYGYTVDGGDYRYLAIESFSAYKMDVTVKGRNIHPGSAKNVMFNAADIVMQFHNALPKYLKAEYTTGRDSFYHLCSISGDEEEARSSYIIRSFDEEEIRYMIKLAKFTARNKNERLGYECIKLDIQEQYHNMKIVLDKYPFIQKEMEDVYKELGLSYEYEAIRGGTTGSQLSFMGLPCPNLGTGDYNMHGKYEYVDIYEMEEMVKVVTSLMNR